MALEQRHAAEAQQAFGKLLACGLLQARAASGGQENRSHGFFANNVSRRPPPAARAVAANFVQ